MHDGLQNRCERRDADARGHQDGVLGLEDLAGGSAVGAV